MSDNREHSVEDENAPLISSRQFGEYSAISAATETDTSSSHPEQEPQYYQNDPHPEDGPASETEYPIPIRGGPTVTCRICEADILLEGRPTHVVRCQNCNEVTPIRAAPPGKKYVRCPCNCLLICKASSNRIACPRPNCRRVITLVATAPMGTAVRAPAGTCRVQCCYCQEMFMFNTLANTVANCPHCKKCSSVGANYARSRALIHFVAFVIALLILLGVVLGTFPPSNYLVCVFWLAMAVVAVYCIYRFIYFARLKISPVLGPI